MQGQCTVEYDHKKAGAEASRSCRKRIMFNRIFNELTYNPCFFKFLVVLPLSPGDPKEHTNCFQNLRIFHECTEKALT